MSAYYSILCIENKKKAIFVHGIENILICLP